VNNVVDLLSTRLEGLLHLLSGRVSSYFHQPFSFYQSSWGHTDINITLLDDDHFTVDLVSDIVDLLAVIVSASNGGSLDMRGWILTGRKSQSIARRQR
jgi:hypothetical protein